MTPNINLHIIVCLALSFYNYKVYID